MLGPPNIGPLRMCTYLGPASRIATYSSLRSGKEGRCVDVIPPSSCPSLVQAFFRVRERECSYAFVQLSAKYVRSCSRHLWRRVASSAARCHCARRLARRAITAGSAPRLGRRALPGVLYISEGECGLDAAVSGGAQDAKQPCVELYRRCLRFSKEGPSRPAPWTSSHRRKRSCV